jgi:hypothetical protein
MISHTTETSLKHLVTCLALAAVIALAAPAPAQETAPSAEDINPAVFEVNGQTVYAAEISMVMRNIAGQYREGEQAPTEQQLLQMATQRVVEQKLLAQEARRFGVEIDEAWVAKMLAAAEQQSGGRETLDANLARIGSDYQQLTDMIDEMDLVRTFIENTIVPTIEVSDDEVAAFYSEYPDAFETDGTKESLEEATPRIRKIITQQKTAQAVGELLESLGKEADIKQLIAEPEESETVGPESVPE